MNEIIPGELWFEIARRNFSVWRVLTKTIKSFWLYVQKIGRERMLEKLFGRAYAKDLGVRWYVASKRYRFGGFPSAIYTNGDMCWHRGDRYVSRNLLSISNACMKVTKPSHGVREMRFYYDGGHSIIGDLYSNSDNSSTISVKTNISLQKIYFQPGAHKHAILYIENDGTSRYSNFTELRSKNLPRFLDRDGLFLPNM